MNVWWGVADHPHGLPRQVAAAIAVIAVLTLIALTRRKRRR